MIVIQDKILFKRPSNFAKPIAQIKNGRLLILKKCEKLWCRVTTEDYEGWINTNNIWGLN